MAGIPLPQCRIDTSIYETGQSLDLRRSDAVNPQRKKTGIDGKRGTLWEIRARRIRKKDRNRTPKNNSRRTKRRRTNNLKEPLEMRHSAAVSPETRYQNSFYHGSRVRQSGIDRNSKQELKDDLWFQPFNRPTNNQFINFRWIYRIRFWYMK